MNWSPLFPAKKASFLNRWAWVSHISPLTGFFWVEKIVPPYRSDKISEWNFGVLWSTWFSQGVLEEVQVGSLVIRWISLVNRSCFFVVEEEHQALLLMPIFWIVPPTQQRSPPGLWNIFRLWKPLDSQFKPSRMPLLHPGWLPDPTYVLNLPNFRSHNATTPFPGLVLNRPTPGTEAYGRLEFNVWYGNLAAWKLWLRDGPDGPLLDGISRMAPPPKIFFHQKKLPGCKKTMKFSVLSAFIL